MDRDEKIELMADQAHAACFTDIGYRLIGATFTDGLVTRVIGADNPNRIEIVKTMTKEAIIKVAEREALALDGDEREQLQDDVGDQIRKRVVAATKHCWTICDALGYDPTKGRHAARPTRPAARTGTGAWRKLNPEAIAWMAAFISIPVDAEHVGS